MLPRLWFRSGLSGNSLMKPLMGLDECPIFQPRAVLRPLGRRRSSVPRRGPGGRRLRVRGEYPGELRRRVDGSTACLRVQKFGDFVSLCDNREQARGRPSATIQAAVFVDGEPISTRNEFVPYRNFEILG